MWSFNTDVPQFYTVTPAGTSLAINTLPISAMEGSVPLDLYIAKTGAFTLTATGAGSFSAGTGIILTDKKTGHQQDLAQNPSYLFNASPSDPPDRFLLTFGHTGIRNPGSSQVAIFTFGNLLYIRHPETGTAEVFDMTGRLIQRTDLEGAGLSSNPINGPTGYYVVRVTMPSQLIVRKVFVHKN
jgi:hypothetical protein